MSPLWLPVLTMNLCVCGCKTPIPDTRSDGKPRTHAITHGKRTHVGEWYKPESRAYATLHERARKLKPRERCELDRIGGCSAKRLEVHHVDGDISNNAVANLVVLCTSHHRLVEGGRIDLSIPRMPAFYVDGSGKRRYA